MDSSYRQSGTRMALRQKRLRQKRRQRRIRLLCCGLLTCFLAGGFIRGIGKLYRQVRAGTESIIWEKETSSQDILAMDLPESLKELAQKNPETIEFVQHYLERDAYSGKIDLTNEVVQGQIPLFLQWDERWGYETYGDDFLAVTGCGPTCLSMVYCGLTGDTSYHPYQMAQLAEREGYYEHGIGTAWSMMTELANKLGLNAEQVPFDETHIRACLGNGQPIICIMGAGDFTTAGHFVVLTGQYEDGRIRVNDPNSILNSEKGWDLQRLMGQIRNLWTYRI